MADLAPIYLDADPLWIGYDWDVPVELTDDETGAPIDISTWTIGGDFWRPDQPAADPTHLTVANIDVPTASWTYEVPAALTALVKPPIDPRAKIYPCRIMAWYLDAAGKRRALRPIYIRPKDPRTDTD